MDRPERERERERESGGGEGRVGVRVIFCFQQESFGKKKGGGER